MALLSLRQGLRAAEQTKLTFANSKQESQRDQTAPNSRCQDGQVAGTAAFSQQLNEIVKIAVVLGIDSVAAQLTPEDQKACLMIAFDDVRGVLIGGAPEVPEKCRPAASAGRAALGKDIREAAVLGARMRFRAVMMTSFAFILGVYPLVVAQGAAEISRHDVGTPVFAGMIAARGIGLFVIPMLHVTFQSLRERTSARFRRAKPRPSETD
jgi:hypothetical protein